MGEKVEINKKDSAKDINSNLLKEKEKDTSNETSTSIRNLKFQDEETKRNIEDSKIIRMIDDQNKHCILDKSNPEEKKESKLDNVDRDIDKSEEKRESKWNNIDWSKRDSEEKKESKWDNIDWSKRDSEKKNEEKKEAIKENKESHNPHRNGTITTTVQNGVKAPSEITSDQEAEIKNKHEKEEIKDWELVTPDGEQEKTGDSPDALKIRAELEEEGLADYTEPFYYHYDVPEHNSDGDLEQDYDSKLEGEPEKDIENPLEKEEIKGDQEPEFKIESYHDDEVKAEIEYSETQEELKEDLQEPYKENLQPLKEKIQNIEKVTYNALKEQYHQETGRRIIYAKQETKGFMEWKEKKKQALHKETHLDKKAPTDTQEIKEESVKYLIKTIKDATRDKKISEDIKKELLKSLKNYDKISELYKQLQNREISKHVFEKEVKKIEKELGDELNLGIFLFNNFEAFRKYYYEMINRAGKRIALVQISPKTKRFLLNVAHRVEQYKKVESIRSTGDLLNLLRDDLESKLSKNMIIDGIKTNIFFNGKLSWNKFSLIISKYGHRIKRIRRNIRRNSNFKVALDELENWKNNLKSLLEDKSINSVNIINNYIQSNHHLPISSKYKVLNYHPNLKIDYFKEINTKDKAYWLGFLWGELYIGQGSALVLDLSKKDEKLMDRYIKALGLNPEFKFQHVRESKRGLKYYIRLRFKCPQMANDLLTLGYKPSRLKKTEFPTLNTRELDLAFLLGFFDAEGKEGTNSLHLGSKKILEQIKEKFDVPYNVNPDKEGYFYFTLGSKLFNEMMDNYSNSLGRKRKIFRVPLRQKFEGLITRDELQKIIWSKPIKEISKEYGVYPKLVIELCDKWNIKRPPSHYWHHNLHGKMFRIHDEKEN
ncbi:MAG: hypothetical protein ACFFA0_01495 [Promethearchaeota archaeon]